MMGLWSPRLHRTGTVATRKQDWGKAPWTVSFRTKQRALPAHADFAIVGGGFTGLAAAAWLARSRDRKSVLVLEAGKLGNGASGRTGGMALAQTAAGDLPGLGDVLGGYRKILLTLGVEADLELPGVWEVTRGNKSLEGKSVRPMKNSPIDWNDSGRVRAVGCVPGGTVNPGKVVSGLAKAAVRAGAQITENAEVCKIEFTDPLRLHVRRRRGAHLEEKVLTAEKLLLATNAGSLELGGSLYRRKDSAEPKLTFAIATAPLTKSQIAAIGMSSGRPFYSVDFPYLWGRLLKNGGMIFGSGLVPTFGESMRERSSSKSVDSRVKKIWSGLEKFDIGKGEPAARIRSLVERVRNLDPALKNVKITHRWGGPILITKNFVPVFRRHPRNKQTMVLGGYSGHGVALSVYLGKRAAEALLNQSRPANW
jgi:glycine/D-amino acid oxidase-like deaminating enzyme